MLRNSLPALAAIALGLWTAGCDSPTKPAPNTKAQSTPTISDGTISESAARDSFTTFVNSKIGQTTPVGKRFAIRKLIVDVDQVEVRGTGLSELPYRASARIWSRSASNSEEKLGNVTLLFEYKNGKWVYTAARSPSSEMKYREQEIDFFKS